MEILKSTTISYDIKKASLEQLLVEQLGKEGHRDRSKISFEWKIVSNGDDRYQTANDKEFSSVTITVKQ